jgi:hypothetical protein
MAIESEIPDWIAKVRGYRWHCPVDPRPRHGSERVELEPYARPYTGIAAPLVGAESSDSR